MSAAAQVAEVSRGMDPLLDHHRRCNEYLVPGGLRWAAGPRSCMGDRGRRASLYGVPSHLCAFTTVLLPASALKE